MITAGQITNELTSLWQRLTDGMSDHPVTITDDSFSKLLSAYDPEEATKFLRDSVAAWIWSNRDKEPHDIPRFYLNASVHSEANTNRVEAYRKQYRSGVSSSPRDVSMEEIRMTESDYLRSITANYFPEPIVLQPSPSWLIACQQLGRPYIRCYREELREYHNSYWSSSGTTVGRVINRYLSRLNSGTKVAKRHAKLARAAMHSSLMKFLVSTGKIMVAQIDNLTEYRIIDQTYKTEIREMLSGGVTLSTVDIMILKVFGVSVDLLDEEEDTGDSIEVSDDLEQAVNTLLANKKNKKNVCSNE